jgi:RHS repeat-associated protein
MYVVENGVGNMYYTYTDNLESINVVTNNAGTIVAEQSFDAWGRRVDVNTLQPLTASPSIPAWLYRGYTGHEMLNEFRLINMNARLYDAVVGQFLSPDNFLQDPLNSQNYARYNYVFNNPLKYIDPTGNIALEDPVPGGVRNTYTHTEPLNPILSTVTSPGGAFPSNWGNYGNSNTQIGNSKTNKSKSVRVKSRKTHRIINLPRSAWESGRYSKGYEYVDDIPGKETNNTNVGGSSGKEDGGKKGKEGAELRSSLNDWGNYLSFGVGAAEYNLGKILADRAKYTFTQAPYETRIPIKRSTIIRTPAGNLSVNASKLANGLKWGGRALGGAGIVLTVFQVVNKDIGYGEAALDASFGAIGFFGVPGFVVSSSYFFVAKPLYKYYKKP